MGCMEARMADVGAVLAVAPARLAAHPGRLTCGRQHLPNRRSATWVASKKVSAHSTIFTSPTLHIPTTVA